ncbi:MAG: GNAT family N-acetyltransferase [Anaerolineales bacterium]|nr:MAG: GNAT family N-acetyltransferase [Anaerolineales bacterium]
MGESPTQPKLVAELQILRTRHPPVTYLHQLCDLLATENISITPDELNQRLDDLPSKERLLLAVEGDTLIGYAHLRVVHDISHGAMAEVAAILIQPHRRRQRFGQRLIAAAESWARQAQSTELLLRCDVAHSAGHAFYTALGYQQNVTQLEFIRNLHS